MKYEVKILESEGTCKNELFEEMAKRGDITATKISNLFGRKLTIQGYAKCEITTEEKTFIILYVDTEEEGIISAGSTIFMDSVKIYFGKCEQVIIKEIKTKQGKTYKAVPVLGKKKEETPKNENNLDELPF